MRNRQSSQTLASALFAAIFSSGVYAANDTDELQRQVDQLKQQLKVVEDKLDAQSTSSSNGRSAVQETLSSVHLAGYAAVGYSDVENGNGAFDSVSFNPIFHYQYSDLLLLEAELEIAVEDTGETETALEYGAINWLLNDYAVLQVGKFLSPIGQFRQNLHPAWINKFASAPPGFGHDGAAPIAEVGAQLRGGFGINNSPRFNYAVYISNGPKVEIVGSEIHGIDTEGSTGNNDDRLVYGGRLGVLPIASLELGVSAAGGEVGPEGEETLRRDYAVIGIDFAWKPGKDWDFRGEYVKSNVGSNAASAAPESAEWSTWYTQGAYRILSSKWEAVLRYGDFDSPHADDDQEQWGIGLNYWIAPNAVAKAGYESNKGITGSPSDDNRALLQLSYGF